MRAAVSCCILTLAQAAQAGPPELYFPVACTLGEECFIQNYVDADPTEGYQDFACGALSYDGHNGTDFAVPTHLDALEGVAVLAAAPGKVRAIREALPDHFLGADPAFPDGQDCGNGLAITHADGWETQYCHLAKGSISVHVGEQVNAGTVLGRIGMSGNTEFPHLHLTLRRDGAVVDPFDPEPDGACGAPLESQLWKTPIAYAVGGLLQAGFSSAVPNFDLVKFGQAHDTDLSSQDGALVLWAHLYGPRAGDELQMMIKGPDGIFLDHIVTFDKPQAQAMRAAGRRLHSDNTNVGDYLGEVILRRNGAEIGRKSAQTILRD